MTGTSLSSLDPVSAVLHAKHLQQISQLQLAVAAKVQQISATHGEAVRTLVEAAGANARQATASVDQALGRYLDLHV